MRRAVRVLAVLAAAVSAVPAAHADPPPARVIPLGADRLQGTPALTSSGTAVWLAQREGRTHVMRARAGEEPVEIGVLPATNAPADVAVDEVDRIAASDEAYVVSRYAETCFSDGCKYQSYTQRLSEVLAGAEGTVAVVVAGCGFAPGEASCDARSRPCGAATTPFAAGSLVGSSQCGIEVWRPGEPTPVLAVPAPSAFPSPSVLAGMNGHELVTAVLDYAGSGTITERDAVSGAVLRTIDVTRVGSVLLGDDGAIAYTTGPSGAVGPHLWLAAVGQPPRDLGPLPSYSMLAGFAHDRFLVAAQGDVGGVEVRGLDGALIARLPALVPSAFDGDHVAYALQPCQASSIIVAPIDAPTPVLPTCVSPEPDGAALAGGVLRVTLRCPPDPRLGCQGTLRVVLSRRRTGPGSRGTQSLPTVDYTVAPGAATTVLMRLSVGARRFVTAGRPTRATVTTTPTTRFYREQTAPAKTSLVRLTRAERFVRNHR
jgi:hypothetical protein